VAVALEMREQGTTGNDLLERLAADPQLPLDRSALDQLVGEPLGFVGTALAQVQAFVDQVGSVVEQHPEAAAYRPEPLL
jgi:adenylosuccinate lyase